MPEIANSHRARVTGGRSKGRIIIVGTLTVAMGGQTSSALIALVGKLFRMQPRSAGIHQRVHVPLAHNTVTAKQSGTIGENVRN